MKKNKNTKVEYILYLENIEDINKIKEQVKSTETNIDDKVFDKMTFLIEKYASVKINDYFEDIIVHQMINDYVEISKKILYKILAYDYDYKKVLNLYSYICNFTEENINYKFSIINEFKKFGIVENRNILNIKLENPFKKFLQVLSCVYRKDRNLDAKSIYENSNSYKIQQKARKIFYIIVELNKKSDLLGQKVLVKPTTTVIEICNILTDIVVDNEKQLKDVVDYLYKLFCENKNLKKYNDSCELDIVNDLRNYFFS